MKSLGLSSVFVMVNTNNVHFVHLIPQFVLCPSLKLSIIKTTLIRLKPNINGPVSLFCLHFKLNVNVHHTI